MQMREGEREQGQMLGSARMSGPLAPCFVAHPSVHHPCMLTPAGLLIHLRPRPASAVVPASHMYSYCPTRTG